MHLRRCGLLLPTEKRGLSVCRTIVSPEKTAEPIEMPFGLRTRVGAGNLIFDGDPRSPCKKTIFGEKKSPL